jgi:hypothetical protein
MLIKGGQPCDDCGSSDALAQYEDGTYCFSCGNRTKQIDGTLVSDCHMYHVPHTEPVVKGSIVDCFLKQRHFTDGIIFEYDLRQTMDGQKLVILDQYLGIADIRSIGYSTGPKYIGVASKKHFFGRCTYSTRYIILVEDAISAIRLSAAGYHCVALRGTKLSETMLQELCGFWEGTHIVTWLDDDAAGHQGVIDILHKLNWCNLKFTNILTEKDPKWYTDNELKAILEKHNVI